MNRQWGGPWLMNAGPYEQDVVGEWKPLAARVATSEPFVIDVQPRSVCGEPIEGSHVLVVLGHRTRRVFNLNHRDHRARIADDQIGIKSRNLTVGIATDTGFNERPTIVRHFGDEIAPK